MSYSLYEVSRVYGFAIYVFGEGGCVFFMLYEVSRVCDPKSVVLSGGGPTVVEFSRASFSSLRPEPRNGVGSEGSP